MPKNLGGLGLRDMEILTDTLGAQSWRRWLQHPNDIWARFWCHKYTPHLKEA